MTNYKYKSLCAQILDLLEVEKHSENFDKIFLTCLEHLCLETKIKDFHNKLQRYVDFTKLELTPSKFRLIIAKSGYVLLNLRFHTVYVSLMRDTSAESFEYFAFQHDIDGQDSQLLEILINEKLERSTLKQLIRKKIPFRNLKYYAPEALKQTVDEFGLMLPQITQHINRSINKFLRFIKKSYNITHDEFVSELMFSAIRAHYRSKPNNNSYEKQLNKIRASVHNYSINIIKQYTTTKRERLINEGQDAQGDNVYTLRVVSENQMSLSHLSDSDTAVDYDSMFSSSLRLEAENETEIEYSVEQLLARYSPRSSQTRLLRAFFYPDCYMFNHWLRKKKLLRSKTKTTRDFLDSKNRREVLDLLSAYLSVDREVLTLKTLPSMAKALGII